MEPLNPRLFAVSWRTPPSAQLSWPSGRGLLHFGLRQVRQEEAQLRGVLPSPRQRDGWAAGRAVGPDLVQMSGDKLSPSACASASAGISPFFARAGPQAAEWKAISPRAALHALNSTHFLSAQRRTPRISPGFCPCNAARTEKWPILPHAAPHAVIWRSILTRAGPHGFLSAPGAATPISPGAATFIRPREIQMTSTPLTPPEVERGHSGCAEPASPSHRSKSLTSFP